MSKHGNWWRVACGLALALAAGATFAAGVPFAKGDVLAAVGSGKIKHFSPTGALLDTLDTTTGSSNTTGMCFDSGGNVYATSFQSAKVSKFDSSGNLLQANFGSGYNSSPESCIVSNDGSIFVGQADGSGDVLKLSAAGALLTSYNVPTTDRGSDWIDLAADSCTLFYTSEGSTVKRYNVCTNTAMADFATGLPRPCFALRIRPNGEVLTACSTAVVRLDSTGAAIGTYPAATYGTSGLFALNLDPDGTSFWTGSLNDGKVVRINIADGAQITQFASTPFTQLAGLAVVGEITVTNPGFTVGGTVSGLTAGDSLILTNNGGNNLAVTVSGSFTFAQKLQTGAAYAVAVGANPAGKSCAVTNGSGSIGNADVTNVIVTCTAVSVVTQQVPTLSEWGLLLLSALLGLGTFVALRRKQS